MRNWQKEIEVHCSKRCALEMIGWDDNNKGVYVYVKVIGANKSLLLISLNSDGYQGYGCKRYTRNQSGGVSTESRRFAKLEEVHEYLEKLAADFDMGYFI
jgi:hypothetical protein